MFNRKMSLFVIFVLLLCILSACSLLKENQKASNKISIISKAETPVMSGHDFTEDRSVYENDKPDSIVHLYVTVLKENNIFSGKTNSMKDLNKYNYEFDGDSKKPKVEVIFQEGSSQGPELGYFGYGARSINASLEPRGHSGSTAVQKSFKIRLYDKAGLWNNIRIINLNKHPADLTRVRNKLSFDYFKLIPNFTSLRTQFVNLHIKDMSDDSPDHQFVDYGLFTMVEQPNRQFLKSHGLDPNGHLYKAEDFEFFRYVDELKLVDDPQYKKKEFEKILSINGSEDHKKLLNMLDDVNDYGLDINKVVEKHFNRDNMLTWIAVNILMQNIDTMNQNFLLYSPLNSDTWYFLPWDYDITWGGYDQIGVKNKKLSSWHYGLSNYWGMVLFKRFFKDPENLKLLNEKIDSLTTIINKKKTTELLNKYHDIVFNYIQKNPDIKYLPSRIENYEVEYRRIADETDKSRKDYFKNLEKPMPVYLGDIVYDSKKIKFTWDKSFDFQENSITYDFEISTDPDFNNIITQRKGLTDTEVSIEQLMPGIYYWRVIVNDSKGNQQVAFDEFRDSEGNYHFGIRQFMVKSQ